MDLKLGPVDRLLNFKKKIIVGNFEFPKITASSDENVKFLYITNQSQKLKGLLDKDGLGNLQR